MNEALRAADRGVVEVRIKRKGLVAAPYRKRCSFLPLIPVE